MTCSPLSTTRQGHYPKGGTAMLTGNYYIDHVGINTNDMEATLQFYCGVLGMRLVRTTRTGDGRRHYNIAIGGGNAFAVFDGAELPAAGAAPDPKPPAH